MGMKSFMGKFHICYYGLFGDMHNENYYIGIPNGLNHCTIL